MTEEEYERRFIELDKYAHGLKAKNPESEDSSEDSEIMSGTRFEPSCRRPCKK